MNSTINRRLRTIAPLIVQGPRALFPPSEIDDFGWLEPFLRFEYWKAPGTTREAIAVYCDNTVNRDADFLRPMIRYAKWERYKDLTHRLTWPTIDIRLSYFDEYRSRVSQHMEHLGHALRSLPFVPFGLGAERDVPDMPYDSDSGELNIFHSNGAQTVEFSSPALSLSDPLTQLFFTIFDDLFIMMQPIARDKWRERYDFNLVTHTPKAWDWYGEAPVDK